MTFKLLQKYWKLLQYFFNDDFKLDNTGLDYWKDSYDIFGVTVPNINYEVIVCSAPLELLQ